MNLHQKFVQLGKEYKALTGKLSVLILEIYKQGVYKKYASDIYEYGRKYSGLSGGTIKKIIWTCKKIENLPALEKAIETAGVHKVAVIANIATPENQQFLAEQVEINSKSAIEQFKKDYVREQKSNLNCSNRNKNMETTIKIELDEETQFLFNKLKKTFGIEGSNKEALKKMLQKFSNSIEEKPKNSLPGKDATTKKRLVKGMKTDAAPASRHIPKDEKVKAVALTNGKCAIPHCARPYDHLHHIVPFSISKKHEDNLIPLCWRHHELCHTGGLRGVAALNKSKLSKVSALNGSDLSELCNSGINEIKTFYEKNRGRR